MVRGNEAHLFGEREVEIEDTTVRAITSLIVDVPVRANVAPGMCAVYLLELLIQGSGILAAKGSYLKNISRKDAKIAKTLRHASYFTLAFAPLRDLCAFA